MLRIQQLSFAGKKAAVQTWSQHFDFLHKSAELPLLLTESYLIRPDIRLLGK